MTGKSLFIDKWLRRLALGFLGFVLTLAPASALTPTQGTEILVNGQACPAPWVQWSDPTTTTLHTGLADSGLVRCLGFELLSTLQPEQQPVAWFSPAPISLPAQLGTTYRFLDITAFATNADWHLTPLGNRLAIDSPPAQIRAVRADPEAGRLVLELDRPTPWWAEELASALQVSFKAQPAPGLTIPPTLKVGPEGLVLTLPIAPNRQSRVFSLANPPRLVMDLDAPAQEPRRILWALGLEEQRLTLGPEQFEVNLLKINPRQAGLKVQPIWSNPATLIGIAPLSTIAQTWQAAAAINGGFFNRKVYSPLGALKVDGQWISSPILDRAVLAWNHEGQYVTSRLAWQETLTIGGGERIPLASLNSGYVQGGIARYSSAWGNYYQPLSGGETAVTVVNAQVLSRAPVLGPVSIPADGYLLVLRSLSLPNLQVGTTVTLEQTTVPPELDSFPEIIGAGPLLLHAGLDVLDWEAEKFSPALANELTYRSAAGLDRAGNLVLVAIGHRYHGPGPRLVEMVPLLQQLGLVEALNLDGGSSSTLDLGGAILNRPERSTARVHNGLGVFLRPLPGAGDS